MRFSRLYRSQKRKVPLYLLRATQKKQPAMSQWRPPTQNAAGREEDWFRGIHTTHRAFCGCGDPILHLTHLAAQLGYQPSPSSRGGSGNRITPPLRTLRALPAAPTTPRPPPCGGAGGRGVGGDRADAGESAGGDDLHPEDVEELLDVLEDAE